MAVLLDRLGMLVLEKCSKQTDQVGGKKWQTGGRWGHRSLDEPPSTKILRHGQARL